MHIEATMQALSETGGPTVEGLEGSDASCLAIDFSGSCGSARANTAVHHHKGDVKEEARII